MPASGFIQLGPCDEVPGRRFAEPEHSLADAHVLDAMRLRLAETLRQANISADDPLSRELYIQSLPEDGARLHRIVILSRALLQSARELTFVGFFGQKRGDANPAVLQDVDTELLHEFLEHTYVLSYSSLELPDGNWANLVLLLHADGIEHWRASQKHAYAARELAPLYYRSIRLHNGMLPGGLASRPVIQSTKYYAFERDGWWQAIRLFRSEQ